MQSGFVGEGESDNGHRTTKKRSSRDVPDERSASGPSTKRQRRGGPALREQRKHVTPQFGLEAVETGDVIMAESPAHNSTSPSVPATAVETGSDPDTESHQHSNKKAPCSREMLDCTNAREERFASSLEQQAMGSASEDRRNIDRPDTEHGTAILAFFYVAEAPHDLCNLDVALGDDSVQSALVQPPEQECAQPVSSMEPLALEGNIFDGEPDLDLRPEHCTPRQVSLLGSPVSALALSPSLSPPPTSPVTPSPPGLNIRYGNNANTCSYDVAADNE